MCTVGKVRCLSGASGVTVNVEYDVLTISADSSGTVFAAILDDNDNPKSVPIDNSGFEFSELHAPVKVV